MGWKKLKEVFAMAGAVKRADVKEDKDGKSRGMGTVTFDQPLEAVQAICILQIYRNSWGAQDNPKRTCFTNVAFLTPHPAMLNGQMLFDRQMHVKMVSPVYLSL